MVGGRGPKVRGVIYCCLADKDLHERIVYLEVGLGCLAPSFSSIFSSLLYDIILWNDRIDM